MSDRLTYEDVSSRLRYDPERGELTWISGWRAGKTVTTVGQDGYLRVSINYVTVQAHRAMWLLAYGEWPSSPVDHKDGNRLNNALSNLRLATVRQNSSNTKLSPRNTTGFKGVVRTRGGKFMAVIKSGKKQRYLGTFSDKEAAALAYATAAKEMFGEFANAPGVSA